MFLIRIFSCDKKILQCLDDLQFMKQNVQGIQLGNIEQNNIDNKISTILYIGPPGSGKSTMIRQFQKRYKCHIFSPTNSSAKLINGTTIYQFFSATPFTLNVSCVKPFDYPYVIIDEIFMFNRYQLDLMIQCAKITKDFKFFYLFGDPYQLRQIAQSDEQYFYIAFNDHNITIQTRLLKRYYRATDPQLQFLLQKYRETGIMDQQLLSQYIQKIDERQLESFIKRGFTLICGTHAAIKHYSKYVKHNIISADGRQWYYGQQVCIVNKYGDCQRFSRIKDYKDGVFVLEDDKGNTEEIFPIMKDRLEYLLKRGDIITVNISQGQTLKGVIIDFASFFEFGSAYTALSRVQKIDDIRMISYPIRPMQVDLGNQFI